MMVFFDIGDGVQKPSGPQHVCILGIQARRDDARLVLARLEVRVREADEDLGQLVSGEKIGEELHRVGPESGDVLVPARNGSGW